MPVHDLAFPPIFTTGHRLYLSQPTTAPSNLHNQPPPLTLTTNHHALKSSQLVVLNFFQPPCRPTQSDDQVPLVPRQAGTRFTPLCLYFAPTA
jgi:hypothetical protein